MKLRNIVAYYLAGSMTIWIIDRLLLQSEGGALFVFLMMVACVLVCIVIFILTKAYYSPALDAAPTTTDVPVEPPQKASLNGRKNITLKELSEVWLSKNRTAQTPQATTATAKKTPLKTMEQTAPKAAMSTLATAQDDEYVPPWDRIDLSEQTAADEIAPAEALGECEHDNDGTHIENSVSFAEDNSKEEDVYFKHESIVDYYNDHIRTKTRGFMEEPIRLRVVTSLLTFLDKYGDCPSVVDAVGKYGEINSDFRRTPATKDANGKKKESFWDVLSRVTLLDHSLNVAKRAESFRQKSTEVPLFIIEALAHDIGKIPEFREGRSYATGDHPIISCNILHGEVDGFNELPENDQKDIEAAIRYHHREKYNMEGVNLDHIRMIQRMDTEARRSDLLSALGKDANIEALKPSRPDPDPPPKKAKKPGNSEKMDTMDMSWFDSKEFFTALYPHINRVKNGVFRAVSTRNGHVYVWVELLIEILNKLAASKGVPEVVAEVTSADVNTQGRYRKLFSLNSKLRKEGFIATNLIDKDFFSGNFLVTHESGRVDKMNATPFNVDAFGKLSSELEELKKDPLVKDIVYISINRETKAEKKAREEANERNT